MSETQTILLVEDNNFDEHLTLRALHRVNLGRFVEVVRDGQQALDYLFGEGEFHDRHGLPLPLVVMLDVNLPRVGGLDVLVQLRANARTHLLPVVVLTSSDEQRDLIESYRNGANSYVRKPVTAEAFTETVGRLGLYWAVTNSSPYKNAAPLSHK
jgi:CheY-like chemotaxis protein